MCNPVFTTCSSTEIDPVNSPKHYNSHPSGVECIQITEHMNFCLGNAVKYIWRAGLKENSIQDLEKARWYIDRELERRRTEAFIQEMANVCAAVPDDYEMDNEHN